MFDINSRTKIYLALDSVSVSSFLYAATVAKIGQRRSLVNLPGSYAAGKSNDKIQREGFTFDESFTPKISADGRYVSASGEIKCDQDAYPGVWDLKKNIKVTIPVESKDGGHAESQQEACNNLFK